MTQFTLLSQLHELLTPGNVHQKAGKEAKHLTDTDEYKAVQKEDPTFAKKLLLAWEGDARDHERSKGKNFDPLFPKMLDAKAIAKFAPDLGNAAKKGLSMLSRLHSFSFPTGGTPGNKDSSVWSHERWVKEGFTDDALNMLREEVETLKEARGGEMHYSPKGHGGGIGDVLILDDANPMVAKLAKALKLKNDWDITSIGGDLYAAWLDGDRLSFAEREKDLEEDLKEARVSGPESPEVRAYLNWVKGTRQATAMSNDVLSAYIRGKKLDISVYKKIAKELRFHDDSYGSESKPSNFRPRLGDRAPDTAERHLMK